MEPFKKKQTFFKNFSLRLALAVLLAAALVLTGCSGQKEIPPRLPPPSPRNRRRQVKLLQAPFHPTPGFTLSMSVRDFPF